ncbi:MAG: extracellular solute-binding protein [Clostridiales bacterium]|nr:extracellular solute-binding protein [Clostridiales bacterium]
MKKYLAVFAATVFLISSCTFESKQVELALGIYTSGDWGVPNPDSLVLFDTAIERFEKDNPNIKVTYRSGMLREDYSEWVAQQALKNTLPDVFAVLPEDFGQFISLGLLKDLSKDIKDDSEFDPKSYYSSALESGKVNGTQYALPFEIAPTMMFVNKTLLSLEGITIPKPNWTWDEFYEICDKISQDKNSDGHLDQFGCYGFTWEEAATTGGSEILDGNTTLFDSDKFLSATQFAKSINALNGGENLTSIDFDKGNVAFCPLDFSYYRAYKPYPYRIKKYSNFEWDCIPMPTNGGYASELQTLQMGISARSSHKSEAWELLKYFTSDYDMQLSLLEYSYGLPVIRSILESNEASLILQKDMPSEEIYIDLAMLGNVIENANTAPNSRHYSEVKNLADSILYPAIYADANIDSMIRILQRQASDLLSK